MSSNFTLRLKQISLMLILTLGPAAKEALLKRGFGTTEVVATIQRRAR